MAIRWQVSKGALFLILTATFLLGGVVGASLLFRHVESNFVSEAKNSLLSIGQLSSAAVQENRLSGNQENAKTTLNLLLDSFPQADRIAVHEPSSLGQSNGTLYEVSKSTSTNSFSPSKSKIESVEKNGASVFPSTGQDSSANSILTALIPVQNENGDTVALVQVDQNPAAWKSLQELRAELGLLLCGAAVFSIGLAWILASFFGSQTNTKDRHPSANQVSGRKRLVVEAILLIAVIFLVIEGGHLLLKQDQLQSQKTLLTQKTNFLFQVESILINNAKVDLTDQERQLAESYGYARLNQNLMGAKTAQEAQGFINHAQSDLARLNAELDLAFAENQERQRLVIILAGAITAASLIAFRLASNKDLQLIHEQRKNLESQEKYQTLVENLPVGLFVYQNGQCAFANKEWIQQLPVISDQASINAWMDAIHNDDRPKVQAALHKAEDLRRPFAVQYRINHAHDCRYMETRGIPILKDDGAVDHILGFSLDITPTIAAKQAVQRAYEQVESKNEDLSQALTEIETSLSSMVRSFVKAVEAKDPYTAGHSERVMQYSLWLGSAIGLGPYELRILELGALVHDVGKIGIPDSILTKADRLSPEEYDVIKMHPVWGAQIVEQVELFQTCLSIVRSHHEMLDGSGYPDQLSGDDIPLLVRIATIADIFDAMTSTRAYRQSMNTEIVLGHLKDMANEGKLDQELCTVFIELVRERGVIPQVDSIAEKHAA